MIRKILLLIVLGSLNVFGQKPSISHGTPKNGSLEHAWKLPRKGGNFIYFSRFSYYLLRNSHTNSKVYQTVLDTYTELGKINPQKKYVFMECSNKKGGKMCFHRTHRNGLSVDFMCPLTKGNKPKYYKGLGFFRYLLNFDSTGHKKMNEKICIDFNSIGEHLFSLEKNARKNGLKISKVILKINLKDELFATEYGKKLKLMNIYFAQKLPKIVDNAHDDHYHVDFEELK